MKRKGKIMYKKEGWWMGKRAEKRITRKEKGNRRDDRKW